MYMLFFLSYKANCLIAHWIVLRFPGGRKKVCEIWTWSSCHAAKFGSHCILTSGIPFPLLYISLSLYLPFPQLYPSPPLSISFSISISIAVSIFLTIPISFRLADKENNSKRGSPLNSLRFAYWNRNPPIHCTCGNGNRLKLKTKCKIKRQMIIDSRPITNASFLPLVSYCRLPFTADFSAGKLSTEWAGFF